VSLSLDDPAAGNDYGATGRRPAVLFGSARSGARSDHRATDDLSGNASYSASRAAGTDERTGDPRAGSAAEQILAAGRIQLSKFDSLADGGAATDGERARRFDSRTSERPGRCCRGKLAAIKLEQRCGACDGFVHLSVAA
jgi:hypothetical protein